MVANHTDLEKRLWAAADQLRTNSQLRASEYSMPVLGLIFLKYANCKFEEAANFLSGQTTGRRQIGPADYHQRGVMYLPEKARYSYLVTLKESDNLGKAINEAMRLIEEENPQLKGVLPKSYTAFDESLLITLMRTFNSIQLADQEGDVFGKIYEYFLGNFAMGEGQRGGEFFTPISLVKLIVEIIEPYHGRILDPACGSGGMFVQSAQFVDNHKGRDAAQREISIYGQEKTQDTIRLCKMNLAVHALEGDVVQANSYYDDPHKMLGYFDFVMANPPFNVDGVDYERLKADKRFPFGLPSTDNANTVWIQLFYSALNEHGRAGFVMANSASDARGSEQTIREKLIRSGAVDVMVAIGSNFFYTVTLPCTLWFLDKAKPRSENRDTVLFIDARRIFTQISRAQRDFSDPQLEFLANIVRLYRGIAPETWRDSSSLMVQHFPDGMYQDVAGLCKVATIAEIEAQGWSLNPGRYVGVAARAADDFDFTERMTSFYERLEQLNAEAHELEARISENMQSLIGGAE